MKKTIFFTVCLSALITLSASAKIWRVNNNPTIPADFTTIQAAHDGAMANDTIHIEPSGISYGNLTMTKKLTIIGNGFFLNENANNQVNLNRSIVNNILMRNGCSGSTITGLVIDNINFQNRECPSLPCISIITDNITIERNYFTGTYVDSNHPYVSISIDSFGDVVGQLQNLIIRDNYIEGSISQPCYFTNCGVDSFYNISILILNNFIKQKISLNSTSNCSTSGVVSNNILGVALNYNSGGGVIGCGLIVKNNIFNDTYNSSVGGNLLIISNNLSSSPTGLPAGNGNLSSVDNTTIFKGLTGNTTDSQWQLKAGSPAIGAGQSGEDCGMFGGTNPYKLSGLPAIPSVYGLSAPVNSNGNTLPITISVKSNNH